MSVYVPDKGRNSGLKEVKEAIIRTLNIAVTKLEVLLETTIYDTTSMSSYSYLSWSEPSSALVICLNKFLFDMK